MIWCDVVDRPWTDCAVRTDNDPFDEELVAGFFGAAYTQAYVVGEVRDLGAEIADRPSRGGACDVHRDAVVHGPYRAPSQTLVPVPDFLRRARWGCAALHDAAGDISRRVMRVLDRIGDAQSSGGDGGDTAVICRCLVEEEETGQQLVKLVVDGLSRLPTWR